MEEDHRPAWGRGCSRGCLLPIRVVVALMGFCALICAYTNRVSISHVLTKLVFPQNRTEADSEKQNVCPPEPVVASQVGVNENPVYHWTEQMQGFVLGSFYLGYLLTHLPGGVLADKYGAKWVLGLCLLISGISTILTPFAIEGAEEWGLMVVRIIMGAAQGPLFPALTTLLSAWVPPKERGTLGAMCYSGVTFGTVLSNVSSGNMLTYFKWPVTLFVLGTASLIWFVIYAVLITSKPGTHPCIKPKEEAYLNETITKRDVSNVSVPWKEMLFSKAMMAVIVSQVGHDWGYYVMITCLPKYMNDVLRFSIKSNGYFTSLPFMAMWCCTIFCGFLADWLVRTEKLTLNTERKLFTFIGAIGPGAFTVIASYSGCNKILVVAMFTLAMFFMGAYYAGQKLTPMDMSPSYSGTIMAITNGLGSFAGLASPPVVGFMTPHATMGEWRMVFWLGFFILVISSIVFWIWGTADIQPYDPKYEEKAAKA